MTRLIWSIALWLDHYLNAYKDLFWLGACRRIVFQKHTCILLYPPPPHTHTHMQSQWSSWGILFSPWLSVCPSVCLWKSGFCIIAPFPFDIQWWWYFTHILTMACEVPLLNLGSKGHGKFELKTVAFPHNSIHFLLTLMILHMYADHDLRRTSIDFRVSRSKVAVNFALFSNDNSFIFWPTGTLPERSAGGI